MTQIICDKCGKVIPDGQKVHFLFTTPSKNKNGLITSTIELSGELCPACYKDFKKTINK